MMKEYILDQIFLEIQVVIKIQATFESKIKTDQITILECTYTREENKCNSSLEKRREGKCSSLCVDVMFPLSKNVVL